MVNVNYGSSRERVKVCVLIIDIPPPFFSLLLISSEERSGIIS